MFTPSESKEHPGFYLIPGYENYLISKDGQVLNLITNNLLRPFAMSNGYRGIHTLYTADGKKVALQHRLMALAFLDPGDRDVSGLVVNHKNGDKTCNDLSNLEWITQQENCIHAGANGLSAKCLPIDVKDYLTKETWKFNSFLECAHHFKVSKDVIRNRILACQGGSRVFPEWRQYRLRSNDPWPEYVTHKPLGRGVAVDVRDLTTGEVLHFKNMTVAAIYLKTTLGVLFGRMHAIHQPIFEGLKQVRFATDRSWRDSQDPLLESMQGRVYRAVVVTNHNTGETTYYKSGADAAKALGILRTTLQERLRTGNGTTVYSDGCSYQYFADTKQSAANVNWQM